MAGNTRTFAVVRAGFRPSRVHTRLAALAWFVVLVPTFAVVWPSWVWWSSALAYAPAGDTMAARIDIVVFKELLQFGRTGASGTLRASLAGAALLALCLNPMLSGGVLGVLSDPQDGRALVERFFAHGARLYGRFLLALGCVGLAGAVAVSVVSGVGQTLAAAVDARGLEHAGVAVHIGWLLCAVAVTAFFTAVLDLARLRLIATSARDVVAASLWAFRLAVRQVVALASLGLVFAALLLVVVVGAVWARAVLPGEGWVWLGVGGLLHQVAALGRMRLRVAVMASELAMARTSAGSLAWPAPAAFIGPARQPQPGEAASRLPVVE